MDMFLKVDITVQPEEVEQAAFHRHIEAFLKTGFMKRRKWELYGGFQVFRQGYEVAPEGFRKTVTSAPPAPHAPDEDKTPASGPQFLNVWRLPKGFATRDVADIMLELADVSSYVELDSHVEIEVQEVVARVNAPILETETDAKTRKEGVFAGVRHYVDRPRLAEFALSSGALAREWSRVNPSWSFLGTFQNVTGLLNVFWDLWQVPPDMTLPKFENALKTLISAKDPITQAYRHSIEPEDGPLTASSPVADFHDGLDILRAAPYWSLT